MDKTERFASIIRIGISVVLGAAVIAVFFAKNFAPVKEIKALQSISYAADASDISAETLSINSNV